jgi:hypothetical protein
MAGIIGGECATVRRDERERLTTFAVSAVGFVAAEEGMSIPLSD